MDPKASVEIQQGHMVGQPARSQPPDIQIRDAKASDAPALARLAGQLGYPAQPAEIIARLPKESDLRQERVIVVTNGAETVIAWTAVRTAVHIHNAPYAEISGFVVDESMRGKGIGKRLMAEVEQWAIGNGLSAIRLNANVRRTESHRFYESLGFSITKQQYAFRKDLS